MPFGESQSSDNLQGRENLNLGFLPNSDPVGRLVRIGIRTALTVGLAWAAVANTLTYLNESQKEQKALAEASAAAEAKRARDTEAENARAEAKRARDAEAENARAEAKRASLEAEIARKEKVRNDQLKLDLALNHQIFVREQSKPFDAGSNSYGEGTPQFYVITASSESQGAVSKWLAFQDTIEAKNDSNGAQVPIYCRTSYINDAEQVLPGRYAEHSSWQWFPSEPRLRICAESPSRVMEKLKLE